jgi:hypothetical protein
MLLAATARSPSIPVNLPTRGRRADAAMAPPAVAGVPPGPTSADARCR